MNIEKIIAAVIKTGSGIPGSQIIDNFNFCSSVPLLPEDLGGKTDLDAFALAGRSAYLDYPG